jgi:hypothetical protein
MSQHKDPISNLEFRIQFAETNLRYIAGAEESARKEELRALNLQVIEDAERELVKAKANHKNKQMRPLNEIAGEIRRDWKKVYFGAVPYLEALECMESPQGNFGCDSGREIIMYFLSNATTWKGETARRIKAELKEALK